MVDAIDCLQIVLHCACMGCRNELVVSIVTLPSDLTPCNRHHVKGYAGHAFAGYAALVATLRRRRMDIGLDQMDLGSAMGMADGYVNKLESFARIASLDTLSLWMQALGLELTSDPAALPVATFNQITAHRASETRQTAKDRT